MAVHAAALLSLATFVFVMRPGPGVFALFSRALAGGWSAGLAVTAGLIAGDTVYLCCALGGLAYVAYEFHALFVIVKLVGAAYLIWLGIQAWRAPAIPMHDSRVPQRSVARDALAGFLTSASNPKVILFYLGLLPNFVDMHMLDATRSVETIGIVAATLFTGCFIYIATCARMRQLFSSARAVRWLNRVSATVLSVAGVLVGSTALRTQGV